MGEVLSQSQIDALLSAMNSAPEEIEPEKEIVKFRKYDFKTPKKFTKDRLRIVDNIYENYARIISSHLTSILRMSCTIELLNVEELRYYEFDNSLSEDDLLVFSDVSFADVPEADLENESAMIVFTPSIITFLVGRMLGSAENRPEDPDYEGDDDGFTEIELAVYETILDHIIPLMGDAWQSYLDMSFTYRRIETNPKLIQALSVDEVIVLISLNIILGERTGQITICLPSSVLDTFFNQLEKNASNMHRRKDVQTEEDKIALISGVENSPLELITRFESATISLNDVYRLHVGDIVNLHIPKDSDVQVCIEDKPWFTGKLGVYKENKAIMITGAIHDGDNEE